MTPCSQPQNLCSEVSTPHQQMTSLMSNRQPKTAAKPHRYPVDRLCSGSFLLIGFLPQARGDETHSLPWRSLSGSGSIKRHKAQTSAINSGCSGLITALVVSSQDTPLFTDFSLFLRGKLKNHSA